MFKSIDHVAVHCSDLEKSTAFYRDVMGFEPWVGHDARIQFFKVGTTLLELSMKQPAQVMSGLHFCLNTDDVSAAVETLRAQGVEVVLEPKPTTPREPSGESFLRAIVKGPDCELIEIRG